MFRLLVALASLAGTGAASALEPGKDEEKLIKSCEQRLCAMALTKKPQGPDLDCKLAKTWAKSTLEGGKSSGMGWGFGDARCTVNLDIGRDEVMRLLTAKEYTIKVPAHSVDCVVESDGKASKVRAKLAPKLLFKNGKAEKIWINLQEIDGPGGIEATVWTAANLVDNVGLFHGKMVKSVNKFLTKHCAKNYDMAGNPRPDPKEVALAAAAKAKARKAHIEKVRAAQAKAAAAKAKADAEKLAASKTLPPAEPASTPAKPASITPAKPQPPTAPPAARPPANPANPVPATAPLPAVPANATPVTAKAP